VIDTYLQENGGLRRVELPATGLPREAVWIDVREPQGDDLLRVQAALQIELPTREEMQEIELSSRIYQEGNATFLTALVPINADTATPGSTAITFIRTPGPIVTLRYADPQPFKNFIYRSVRPNSGITTPDLALIGLFDAIIDREADLLERMGAELDGISKAIFATKAAKADVASADLEEAVRRLGQVEDLNSRVRESAHTLLRMMTYLGTGGLSDTKPSKDFRNRVKVLQRDLQSIAEQSAFLANKGSFLLDATLGLINIQQTAIIKIFSVAAVVFLPPTLVASIYGMNFDLMPELKWDLGYPFALALMVLSAALPYLYFKRRGWL
jgi:magnesium transporter